MAGISCDNTGTLTIVLNINSKGGVCPSDAQPPCPPCPPGQGGQGAPPALPGIPSSGAAAITTAEEGQAAREMVLQDITDPYCDPNNPCVVSYADVVSAYDIVKSNVERTPLSKSRLGQALNVELYFKKEFMQYTGNFKERGANHAIYKMKERNPNVAGAVSASAGNHASAMAYHGKLMGIPVVVVMPVTAPMMKRKLCEDLGATVVLYGSTLADCKKYGLNYAKNNGMEYINGYDQLDILAGAGTIALEIMEDIPDVDVIISPVGGGGLLAGTCAYAKGNPFSKPMIIGVETDTCPGFSEAMKAGKPSFAESMPSLAEGLAVPVVGCNSYATAAPLVDRVVVVEEKWVMLAILYLIEYEKAVVEGAGAVGLAAILSGELNDVIQNKKVAVILSGGNIDVTVLARVIERALAADGRLIELSVIIQDKPTKLPELLQEIGAIGANVVHLEENRAFVQSQIWNVEVRIRCEVLGKDMINKLQEAMRCKYGDRFRMLENPVLK